MAGGFVVLSGCTALLGKFDLDGATAGSSGVVGEDGGSMPRDASGIQDAGDVRDGSTSLLRLTKAGTGLLTSQPAGIACGSDNVCMYTGRVGDVVTVNAAIAADGSFAKWGDGTGCGNSSTCSFPLTTALVLSTVTFKRPLYWFKLDNDLTSAGRTASLNATTESSVQAYGGGKFGQGLAMGTSARNGLTLPVAVTSEYTTAPTSRWTLSFWFYESVLRISTTANAYVFSNRGSLGGTALTAGWETYRPTSGDSSLVTCLAGTTSCFGWTMPTTYQWHHVVYRSNGNNSLESFLDDMPSNTLSGFGPAGVVNAGLNNFVLGDNTARNGQPTAFTFDDVRVYDDGLDREGQCVWIMRGAWSNAGSGVCTPPPDML